MFCLEKEDRILVGHVIVVVPWEGSYILEWNGTDRWELNYFDHKAGGWREVFHSWGKK